MTTRLYPPDEAPILFGAPMVRAILAGLKDTTRRIIRIDDLRTKDPRSLL